MKKLDQYIIRKYLTTFFFVALIFTLIAVVIDFSDKVEEFIDEQVALQEILFDYYLSFVMWINGLLWSLYALIAVIFFTSRMAFNSEVVSILSAGISFRRFLRPYLMASGMIALLSLVGNHFIIPLGNKTKLDFEHSYIWKESDRGKTDDVHMFIGPEEKAYVRFFRKSDTTALDLRVEKFDGNQLTSMLKSKSAEWRGAPNHWRLRNYEIRTFDGLEEGLIIGKGKFLDTTINLMPEDFVRYNNEKERMPTPELYRFIDLEKQRGLTNTKIFQIEIYRRTADPITIIILTIIGVSVASRKVRGGLGLHLAVGIGIGAIFVFMSRFSVTFATNESLHPALGVWLPNLFFGLIAIGLLLRAQK